MEVRRTVPVKLDVAESDADLLHETIQQFRWAANYVVRNARNDDGYIETGKGKLNSRTYEDVRRETDLHANLVQAARSRAAEALKSVVAKCKRGKKASLPHFTSPFLEYDKRSATFHDDHASLSTVGGRITAEYVLPDEDRDTPHSSYLFSDDYETTGATLHYRENRSTQDTFKCQKCGYANHADYNAAKNIGYKLLRKQNAGEGGAPVGVRLNTGMLNANGVSAVPNLVRAGVHGECHGL